MSWCEANRVDYVFGLARNSRLEAALTDELAQAKQLCMSSGKPARVFRDFQYRTHKSWSRTRRVVGKAEHTPDGSNPRFVVTSLKRTRVAYAMPGRSTKISIARGAKPRTASASSSRCSPIAHHRRRCRPISCGCRSLQWPTCWSTLCVVSACVIPNSPTHRSRPFASSSSSSALRFAPACVAFISPSPPDAPTRLSSRSRTSIFGARLGSASESYPPAPSGADHAAAPRTPMHGQKHTYAASFCGHGTRVARTADDFGSNPSTRPLATVESAADRRAHPTKTALV